MNVPIRIEFIDYLGDPESVELPEKATNGSAGYDVRAAVDVVIAPNQVGFVPLGFKVAVQKGWKIELSGRSMWEKKGFIKVGGKVDSDYRGEVCLLLYNTTDDPFIIPRRGLIGQMEVMPTFNIRWTEVDELDDTERGEGGFGSTGE